MSGDRHHRIRLTDEDRRRIREHLDRQQGVAAGYVRLDDGRVVREGGDAEGEADDERC